VTLAQLIPLAVSISMGLIVFALALHASWHDVTSLLRRPSLLARSLLAMIVVMPLLAAGVAAAFGLHHAIEVALILLAVSPVPPILPGKELKAGGRASYAIGLLATSALLTIATAPLSVILLGKLFGRTVHVTMGDIWPAVAMSVLAPLALGLIVKRVAPSFSMRAAKPLSGAATVLLVVACLPILVQSRHALAAQLGDGTLIAVTLFVIAGVFVGHVLGGPDPHDRTVLALSTASRHPGVAMAVAHAAAPEDHGVPGAVLFAFLVGTIATIPYVKWRQRVELASASAAGTPREGRT
jgi:BASS family bile acid:Na+ symporter